MFYGRADFTEGDGNLNQNGGLVPVAGIGVPTAPADTDDRRFFQKYSAGARWYPSRRATLDVAATTRSTTTTTTTAWTAPPTIPALAPMSIRIFWSCRILRLTTRNIRLTLRPWNNVTAVSRYEYQLSTIDTAPDPSVGLLRSGILQNDQPYHRARM